MDDVETGNVNIYHGGDKPCEFDLKVVVYGELEVDNNDKVQSCNTREKSKKTRGHKKASKPPRHPNGPSLDETDRIFIEELVLKRVKTERLKELKRLNDTCAAASTLWKGSSYYILVIIIIILALLILIHIMKFGA